MTRGDRAVTPEPEGGRSAGSRCGDGESDETAQMGSLKKRRKTKINKHKRRKRLKLNRHKKRLRYKS